MEPLRLILFFGLVFHKLLWEMLKRRDGMSRLRSQAKRGGGWLVKAIKTTVLVFLAFQTLFLDLWPISDQPSQLQIIGTAIYFTGLLTAVIGRLQLGKNWVDLEDYQVLSYQSVVTKGIYRYVRHPIYTGDLLLLIGLELALNSWLVLAISIPLVIILRQASAEETILSKAFPDYPAYCKQTKKFIPFVV